MFLPSNHSLQGLKDPPPAPGCCYSTAPGWCVGAIMPLPAWAEKSHEMRLAAKTHTHGVYNLYVDAYSLQDTTRK